MLRSHGRNGNEFFGVCLAFFYTLIGFSRHFMCIIQILTIGTCSSAPKWVENDICVLGCMLMSHARNDNEFETPRHRGSDANIAIHGF